jgi:peptidyl-prolyl cis-trans isomerase D
VRRLAFELEVGESSGAVNVGRGYVFFRVLEEKPSHIPGFEEAKDRVRAEVVRERAASAARARAVELREKLAGAGNLAAAAKAAGLELQTQESFQRGGTLGGLGRSAAVEQTVFRSEPNLLSEPLAGDAGYVLLRVVERSGYSAEQFSAERANFTEQLLNERRTRLWNAYLQQLQTRLNIQRNPEALASLVG